MINLDSKSGAAIEKLDKEHESIPKIADNEIGAKLRGKEATATKAALMAGAVKEMLKDLCLQCEDFAQAVLAGGDLFACMKRVAEGEGNYVDGMTACRKAVQFYVPGAEVVQKITVQMPGSDGKNGSAMLLNLEDLL